MMNNQPNPLYPNQDDSPVHVLADQFGMTREETRLIINIIQQRDPPIESLKQPIVQRLVKQRKGRWVKEEEAFANFLSNEFSLGLADIENGVTKRAYMSSKLECTKMRISKKYKGSCLGKEVFTQKLRRPDGREFTRHEVQSYRKMHEDLEKKFIKSVVKSVIKGSVKKRASLPADSQHFAPILQLPNASFMGGSTGTSPIGMGCFQQVAADAPTPSQNFPGHAGKPNTFRAPGLVPVNTNPGIIGGSTGTSPIGMGCFQQVATDKPTLSQNFPGHAGKPNTFRAPGLAPVNTNPSNNASAQGNAVMGPPSGFGMLPPAAVQQHVLPNSGCSQPAVFSEPAPNCLNQPNSMSVMKMQVPAGIAYQVQNNGFGPTAMPALQRTTAVNHAPELQLSLKAPDFLGIGQDFSGPNNVVSQNNYTSMSVDNGGIKRMQTDSVTTSVGHTFPQMLNTGGFAQFQPPLSTATASQAVSASDPSSNDESEHALSSNDASSHSDCFPQSGGRARIDSGIPDLLQGFDNHVASMKHASTIPGFDKPVASMKHASTVIVADAPIPKDSHFFAGAGIAESPYITSKSFDELHSFLGKGLSEFDLNLVGNKNPACNTGHGAWNPSHGATASATTASQRIGSSQPNGAFAPYYAPQVMVPLQAPPTLATRRTSGYSSDLTTSD